MKNDYIRNMPEDPDRGAGQRFWSGLCIFACLIALVSTADGLVAARRTPANRLDLLPGQSVSLSGNIYGNAQAPEDLVITTDTSALTLELETPFFKGFWLGTQMWRGSVTANTESIAGAYILKVFPHDLSGLAPKDIETMQALSTYTVRVYADAQSLQQSQASFIRRYTGISPWLPALGAFLLVIPFGAAVYRISSKIDAQMVRQGRAEVYRVSRTGQGAEIYFGLGLRHGLEPGESLRVLDKMGKELTRVSVAQPGEENSSAFAGIPNFPHGCLVARIN